MRKGTVLLSLVLILLCACGGSKNKQEERKRGRVIIVENEHEIGKYGDDYIYLNSNSSYRDKDGNTWYRNDIYAPKRNETMEDYKRRKGY